MGNGNKKGYFSENIIRYDQWYDKHQKEYRDQVKFLKPFIPRGKGIEIGVGTGRFASALNIGYGVDYVGVMVEKARERGINAILADASNLPFPDKYFDYAFSMVTICFLDEPAPVLLESKRVAKRVISVILDRDCQYLQNIIKNRQGFYKYATFYTEKELVDLYRKLGFGSIEVAVKDFKTTEGETYRLVVVSGN